VSVPKKKEGRDATDRKPWKVKIEWCPAYEENMRFRVTLNHTEKKEKVVGVGPTLDAALADAVGRATAMGK
jgi:hypothetical protein